MATESTIQGLVHALEHGRFSVFLKRLLLVVGVLAIATIYIIFRFRGLESGTGMDQAQLAREIARGHGFVTQTIRPLAVAQLEDNGKNVDARAFPDTYHAPLNPYIEAPLLSSVKAGWNPEMKNEQYVPRGDVLIAILALVFFGAAVLLNYFTALLLFDEKLAVLGTCLALVSDIFWKYSMSGLPQMLMLLLFSGVVHLLVRALSAQANGRSYGYFLAGVGVLFGLLLLAHGLTFWILLGALVFIGIAFKPRGVAALIVLTLALAIYAPWLWHTYKVAGSPFGVALYSQLDGVVQSEAAWMRQPETSVGDIDFSYFRGKVTDQTNDQIGRIFFLLGSGITPIFFLALLHPFKRRETADLRWALLSMWIFGFVGMTVAGLGTDLITPNQLHLLFIPIMLFYAMAMLMILWSRLEITFPYARVAFITVIFLFTSIQLILTLLPKSSASRLAWPPYAPPVIALLNKWMQPDEIIASDMPYAVAWYADRKSVWIPRSVEDFNKMNDYNQVQMPINALYLTPVTSRLGVFPNIAGGEYKNWAGIILRNAAAMEKFPLRAFTPLPINGESSIYADHDRWSQH